MALTQASAPAFAQQPYDPRWWQLFQDPVLDRLEAAALAGNHDIRQAVARVDQARAIFRDVELDRYPVVEARRLRGRSRAGDSRLHHRARSGRTPIAPGWWRSGSSTSSAASARPCGRRAPKRRGSTRRSRTCAWCVAAEVARNYFLLRGLQQQLAVAERSLTNQREALRLTGVRRDAGVGEEQDVASAAASVAAVEASIPPLRAGARDPAPPAGGADRRTAGRSGRGPRAARLTRR